MSGMARVCYRCGGDDVDILLHERSSHRIPGQSQLGGHEGTIMGFSIPDPYEVDPHIRPAKALLKLDYRISCLWVIGVDGKVMLIGSVDGVWDSCNITMGILTVQFVPLSSPSLDQPVTNVRRLMRQILRVVTS